MFFEHEALYGQKGEVPEGEHRPRFGEARMVREGGDVTIVSCGPMVNFSEKACDKLASEGVGIDFIDLRTTSPLDEEAILDSVEQTGRLVVVDESPPRCRLAARRLAIVAAKAFTSLKGTPGDGHRPARLDSVRARTRARLAPLPQKIEDAVRHVLAFR